MVLSAKGKLGINWHGAILPPTVAEGSFWHQAADLIPLCLAKTSYGGRSLTVCPHHRRQSHKLRTLRGSG